MDRIPRVYRESVLQQEGGESVDVGEDEHCLATLEHFRSLMPLAQEARKPMFFLKAADGAIGSHATAAQDCYRDFRALAEELARRTGIART